MQEYPALVRQIPGQDIPAFFYRRLKNKEGFTAQEGEGTFLCDLFSEKRWKKREFYLKIITITV